MEDEGASWLDEVSEDTGAGTGTGTGTEGGQEGAAPGGEAPAPVKEEPLPTRGIYPEVYPTKADPNKGRIYTHWARPTFLQYDYNYHYRHNYYDDYIDYLDRRQRGLEVEAPRPQTWAERALRTYTRNTYPFSTGFRMRRPDDPDQALLHTSHWANTWHSEHSKDFYNRKYKAILF